MYNNKIFHFARWNAYDNNNKIKKDFRANNNGGYKYRICIITCTTCGRKKYIYRGNAEEKHQKIEKLFALMNIHPGCTRPTPEGGGFELFRQNKKKIIHRYSAPSSSQYSCAFVSCTAHFFYFLVFITTPTLLRFSLRSHEI